MRLIVFLAALATPAFALEGAALISANNPLSVATVAIQVAEPTGGGRYRSHECSGVLIAQDLVLTAGHCVDRAAGPEHIAVFFFEGSKAVAPYAKVARIAAHPAHSKGWAAKTGDIETRQQQIASDLAILRLAAPAPDNRTPLGFDAGGKPQNLVIAATGRNAEGTSGTLKRSPLGGLYHTKSGPDLAFGSPDGHVCVGDSGGPAVTAKGGIWGVLGAIIRAEGGCSKRAVVVPADPAEPGFVEMLRVARGG